MRAERAGRHVSGAEGLYRKAEVNSVLAEYFKKAMVHSRGRPDSVVISVEEIRQRPRELRSLDLCTMKTGSIAGATEGAVRLLEAAGVSIKSAHAAFELITTGPEMRGAAMVTASGMKRRLEPDAERGVRASRLGIGRRARATLSRRLSTYGIDTPTVQEALVVATKVMACRGIVAELCVSDDPHYTTGYVSSRKFGYVRVPNIKRRGSRRGGRVFFLGNSALPVQISRWLERRPVIVTKIGEVAGQKTLDEIIGSHNR